MSGYKMVALCGCAAAILILAGCGGGGNTTTSGKTATMSTEQRTLTESDAGTTVMVSKGDTFQVVLTGNPTTGYQWVQTAGNTSIISQLGEATFQPDSDAVGAGGKVTLRFEALSLGTTALKLEYRRSWETMPAEKTYEVVVQVS